MTRNEFIQRLVIREYSPYENMERFVEYAHKAADKLEACGVPFDEEPKLVGVDLGETSNDNDMMYFEDEPLTFFNLRDETVEILRKNEIRTFKDLLRQRKTDISKICSNYKDLINELTNLLHKYGYDWAVDN